MGGGLGWPTWRRWPTLSPASPSERRMQGGSEWPTRRRWPTHRPAWIGLRLGLPLFSWAPIGWSTRRSRRRGQRCTRSPGGQGHAGREHASRIPVAGGQGGKGRSTGVRVARSVPSSRAIDGMMSAWTSDGRRSTAQTRRSNGPTSSQTGWMRRPPINAPIRRITLTVIRQCRDPCRSAVRARSRTRHCPDRSGHGWRGGHSLDASGRGGSSGGGPLAAVRPACPLRLPSSTADWRSRTGIGLL